MIFQRNLYYFLDKNIKKTSLDNILRVIERLQHLINDNTMMTLADDTKAFDCNLNSSTLNSESDENSYVTAWDWSCLHMDL